MTKTRRLPLITLLVVVALLITTGMVFAVSTVNQGQSSIATAGLATGNGSGDHQIIGDQSPVGEGGGKASIAAQEVDRQSTVTGIAAAAGGSNEPPLEQSADKGNTVKNNDFTIERTGTNNTLGDGVDEATLWTFDFTTDPDFRQFQDTLKKEKLKSAVLTLSLIPKASLISTDTLKVGNLPAIGTQGSRPFGFPPIQALPRDIVSIVEIELLSFYTPAQIQSVLAKSPRGKVPARFSDDAIVVFAHLRLSLDTTKN
jgi:hypothetical protein